jgi:hypothetical protein
MAGVGIGLRELTCDGGRGRMPPIPDSFVIGYDDWRHILKTGDTENIVLTTFGAHSVRGRFHASGKVGLAGMGRQTNRAMGYGVVPGLRTGFRSRFSAGDQYHWSHRRAAEDQRRAAGFQIPAGPTKDSSKIQSGNPAAAEQNNYPPSDRF